MYVRLRLFCGINNAVHCRRYLPSVTDRNGSTRQNHRRYHKKDLKAEFSYFKTPSGRLWQVRHLIHTPTAETSN